MVRMIGSSSYGESDVDNERDRERDVRERDVDSDRERDVRERDVDS